MPWKRTLQAAGPQNYLKADPIHEARQLQTLHVTPACHIRFTRTPTNTHVLYARIWRHSPRVFNHPAHFLTISSLPSPPLPVCMSFSVTRLSAILHRGELPQYWGIVSYTGNFLPRCQAYFTLICLQRLLIKQPCLYTYLYRSPARATLHAALDSMLLNIYLHWMSTEEE